MDKTENRALTSDDRLILLALEVGGMEEIESVLPPERAKDLEPIIEKWRQTPGKERRNTWLIAPSDQFPDLDSSAVARILDEERPNVVAAIVDLLKSNPRTGKLVSQGPAGSQALSPLLQQWVWRAFLDTIRVEDRD